jgi:hypothetical protein
MSINWSDIINVLIALAIFKVVDKLFLDSALEGLTGGAEGDTYEMDEV